MTVTATLTRRSLVGALLAAGALHGTATDAGAQAGYPPPMPGQAPPSFDNAPRQHEEILRQQQIQRQQFDQFQRGQQIETDRNLETLRRGQASQREALDSLRRDQLRQERRMGVPNRQVQGRRPRRPLTEGERERIDRAARDTRPAPFPSILIEDPPRRRPARRRRTRIAP